METGLRNLRLYMQTINLNRTYSSDQGTLGFLRADDFSCIILELPWRDNQRNISCIPDGEYKCSYIKSNRFGYCYWVQNVPDRSGILFHAGNVAGDRDKGYRTDSLGCLLVGSYSGNLWGQTAVLGSRKAKNKFLEYFQGDPFILTVTNRFKL